MERSEHAGDLFLDGNNCAQSVLLSFAEDIGYSKELALKVAAGFGGGMGRMQGTCGAVTGAIMVLGILEGEKAADNSELKSSSYEAVKEFFVRFTDEYQTTNCKDLTSCDFGTDAGSLKFKNEGVMEKICVPCVMRAVKIVEEIT
ncbi:MAG: C_GCAxxG_C_C family protein [Bacteroidetes bacterium]|nr:C_GCAxxG_C_C family protein [Bacteroidota bacterium]